MIFPVCQVGDLSMCFVNIFDIVVIVVFVNVFAIVVVVFVNESGLHSQPACEWRSEVTFLSW